MLKKNFGLALCMGLAMNTAVMASDDSTGPNNGTQSGMTLGQRLNTTLDSLKRAVEATREINKLVKDDPLMGDFIKFVVNGAQNPKTAPLCGNHGQSVSLTVILFDPTIYQNYNPSRTLILDNYLSQKDGKSAIYASNFDAWFKETIGDVESRQRAFDLATKSFPDFENGYRKIQEAIASQKEKENDFARCVLNSYT